MFQDLFSNILIMEDTFGRLPDDTLKYMCLMSIIPKISFILENEPVLMIKIPLLLIELPLIGISYKFWLCNKQIGGFNPGTRNQEIEIAITEINGFNSGIITLIDFGDYQIYLNEANIHFYNENSQFSLDIKYLKLLQNVLTQYKEYLEEL